MKITKTIMIQAFIFLFSKNLYCINDNLSFSARASGISNASVTYSDIWAVSYNQAGLAEIKHFTVAMNYENRFMIPELSVKSFALGIPSKSGVFGLSYYYNGYSKFNEDKIGIAYSKSIGRSFSIGIQFDYLYTHFAAEYGAKGSVASEIGMKAQPVKNLYVGIHVFNPGNSKIKRTYNEKIPTIFKSGLAYDFSGKVYLSAEIEKDNFNKTKFKTGLEYRISKCLVLRTGLAAYLGENSFGIGYYVKKLKIDLAYSNNRILGMTSAASICFEF
jgi:hypothetical protein